MGFSMCHQLQSLVYKALLSDITIIPVAANKAFVNYLIITFYRLDL